MSKQIKLWLLSLACILFTSFFGCSGKTEIPDPPAVVTTLNDINKKGKGEITFNGYAPLSDKPINIWYYTPEDNPKDLPILFVFHGLNRNAGDYRNNWVALADQYKILIVAPEFSDANYPKSRSYNLGNMFDENEDPVEEDRWTFSLIEPIFDFVVSEINGAQTGYDAFGHSAGSQFGHRFLTYKADTRLNRLIAANAGWYTLLDFGEAFPYGLQNSPASQEGVTRMLQKEIIVLLGEEDTDAADPNLRKTPEANAQGLHRFARGQFYFQAAKDLAEEYGVSFNWSLETVPRVGHSNSEMATPAAKILFE